MTDSHEEIDAQGVKARVAAAKARGLPVAKAVVLEDGSAVSGSTLDQYATKGDTSRQLPSDEFSDSYSDLGSGDKKIVKPLYNPTALARLTELNTYHQRAVRTKARDVAGQGWRLVPREDLEGDPSPTNYDEAMRFLEEPDPELGLEEILERFANDLFGQGNGALELMRGDAIGGGSPLGRPIRLAHMPAHTVRRTRDRRRFVQSRGREKVWFKRVGDPEPLNFDTGDFGSSVDKKKLATEVLWLIQYTGRSDFYGAPDVLPALPALIGDRARQEFVLDFFENHAVPRYAVTIIGAALDEKLRQQLQDFFHNKIRENRNATFVMTIGGVDEQGDPVDTEDVKVLWEPLDVEVHEASFRLFRKDNRDEILSANAVPPYRAGIAETGSLGGTTAKESTEIYKQSVVDPAQRVLSRRITRWILRDGFGVDDWVFQFAEIDVRDEADVEKRVISKVEAGLLSPNEGRLELGLETIDHPAMDLHYVANKPIDGVDPEEVVASVRSLHGRLIELVSKADASSEDAEDLLRGAAA